MSRARSSRLRAVGAFARETATIGMLYGLWRLAGRLSLADGGDAFGRARRIARVEHDVRLPSEHSIQRLILGHRLVVQVANLYYAAMHFTVLLLFLIWLFVRHRDRYRPVRQVLAWTTLSCLLVQLIPVAPPRMLPGLVDTGLLYHQSVYSTGFPADQLAAMPSVHVAWAVLVGYYVWRISPSRWRLIGPLHAVLTIGVVLATGNHWWLDGIVAVGLLSLCAWVVAGVRLAWRAGRARFSGAASSPAVAPGREQRAGAGSDGSAQHTDHSAHARIPR
jgi:hypothetical protein